MSIPLEDTFTDIIGKPIRGQKLEEAAVAQRAGVTLAELQALRGGEFNGAVAEKVAPVLGLNARALAAIAQKRYTPADVTLEGLEQCNTVYEDMTVNAYLVWDPATRDAAIFDTGTDVGPMLATIAAKKLTLRHIFITHTHIERLSIFKPPSCHVFPGAKLVAPSTGSFSPVHAGTPVFSRRRSKSKM